MDWRQKMMMNQRVLTQVPVGHVPVSFVPATPEPVIERGPVLYGARGQQQMQQQMMQQQQMQRAQMQRMPPHMMQQQQMPPPVSQQQMPQPARPPPVATPVVQQSHYQSLTPGGAAPQAMPQVAATLAPTRIAEEFLELNSSNSLKFANMHADILTDLDRSPSQWHQVTIKTPVPDYERKFVIEAINKRISPQKITPYFFRMENMRITFHVNMCGLALRTLCRRDLFVPYTSHRFHEIEMTIKLFNKTFNLSEALKAIVSTRLDSQKKFLDLSYINDIPEIQEMLFEPSENWHIVDQLLRVAAVEAPALAALRLAGNGIVTLNLLWDFLVHSKWKHLRVLDVSDNEVKRTGTVSLSRNLQISEVYLDRNPICEMHRRDPYISGIRATFPHLAKLDGTYIKSIYRLPYWKPNFIVDGPADPAEFADQFIEHFFSLYDDPDRSKLHGLYHERAYFSLKCYTLESQMTTPNARLSVYLEQTRNLLSYDKRKARELLTYGSENILERFDDLPKTMHDPYTFAVDLTVHTPKFTVLTVSGVFRDIAKEKSSHRHFCRTFLLTQMESGEYQITNDILYVSNATTREAEEGFRYLKPPKKVKKKPTPNLSEVEKESMTGMLQQLTSMSAPWSRKCLEDTDWDMKEALQIFLELYETGKIPKTAFITSK